MPGHPRFCVPKSKAWMPGTRPGMTMRKDNAFIPHSAGNSLNHRAKPTKAGGMILSSSDSLAGRSGASVTSLLASAFFIFACLTAAQAQVSPSPSAASSAPASTPVGEPIGNVATLTGTATAIRNEDSLPLKLKDDIYLNDVLVTSANSTLGVTFNDATTFNL